MHGCASAGGTGTHALVLKYDPMVISREPLYVHPMLNIWHNDANS